MGVQCAQGWGFPAASPMQGVSPPAPKAMGSNFRPIHPRNAICSLHLLCSRGMEWAYLSREIVSRQVELRVGEWQLVFPLCPRFSPV